MKIQKVNECMEHLKKAVGDGLMTSSIVSYVDGQSLINYKSNPKTDALISQMTTFLQQVIDKAGFGGINDYYLVDLDGTMAGVIIVFDNYCWGIGIDKAKCPLGMLLNVYLPDFISEFKACL